MLKKITEPQAMYTKGGNAGAKLDTSSSKVPKKMSMKKKMNWKLISGILIVTFVAVAGIAGVLIAQRQQQVEGPVAPNAPSSQPQAAIPEANICSLGFEVAGTPATNATCVSKTAKKVVGTTKTTLNTNGQVMRGDTVEYTITIATTTSTNSIQVSDKLPAQLTLVANSLKVDKGSMDSTLTDPNQFTTNINVPSGIRGLQVNLTYQAKVNADAQNLLITNAAKITTNNDASTADNSCKMTLQVYVTPPKAPPSGVAQCETKTAYNVTTKKAYTTSGNNVSTVKRGDIIEYRVNVVAEKTTKGAVVVTDTLPAGVTYVPNSSTWTNTTPPSGTSKVITFNMGVMAQNGKKQNTTISYKVKVNDDAAVALFNNAAKVVTAADNSTADTCNAILKVAPVGVAQCEEKSVTNASGAAIANESVVQKGDTLTYKVTVTADETTSGPVVLTDTLPASVTYDSAVTSGVQYNASTRKITMNLGTMGDTADNKSKTVEYKVKVNTNANPGDFTNEASVTTGGTNASGCHATLRIAYQCNSKCETDDQCSSIGAGYICSIENGNTCRSADNPSSSSCEGATPSYSCNSSCDSDTQCQGVNSNYVCAETNEGRRCRNKDYETQTNCEAPGTSPTPTPTPTIGCNTLCASNADCTNPDHICSTTADGSNRCRLAEYPSASNCVVPGTPGTPVAGQPSMPEELPVTGPTDWVNWLKAGLVTMGIGAVLLLLL